MLQLRRGGTYGIRLGTIADISLVTALNLVPAAAAAAAEVLATTAAKMVTW